MSLKKSMLLFLSGILFLSACQAGVSQNEEEKDTPHPSANPSQGELKTGAENVSDGELEKFATANKNIQLYNQDLRRKMMIVLSEEGLEEERFGEIMQLQEMPEQSTPNVSAEEMAKFERAQGKIREMQMGAQKAMEEKVVLAGLTIERYREITLLVQQDPELQRKIKVFR